MSSVTCIIYADFKLVISIFSSLDLFFLFFCNIFFLLSQYVYRSNTSRIIFFPFYFLSTGQVIVKMPRLIIPDREWRKETLNSLNY